MVALPTDILPATGTPVILDPSPKKAEAQTLLLTWTSPFTVTLPPRHTFPNTSSVPPIVRITAYPDCSQKSCCSRYSSRIY